MLEALAICTASVVAYYIGWKQGRREMADIAEKAIEGAPDGTF